MNNKILNNYFFVLFSIIPISIIFGSAISLINILIIDCSFIVFLLFRKDYNFLSSKTVKLIFLLCLYLIFNSIISQDFSVGALRNLGFIRFGILFVAFNYFFFDKVFFNKILTVWSFVLSIVVIDVFIESFTGSNILGYGEAYGNRIVSFFKDEPIVGGFINSLYLIIIGFFFSLNGNFSKNYRYILLTVSLIFMWSIILTGERSNSIKVFLGFLVFFTINDNFKIKEKLIAILLLFILMASLMNGSSYLKLRYKNQFLEPIIKMYKVKIKKEEVREIDIAYFKDNSNIKIYALLYKSGYSVFKNYPFFGVGNKNYRVVACKDDVDINYICNTHPHQTYLELLAEHGLIGATVVLFIFFNLIFSILKIILQSKNYIQIGCFIFLILSLMPFIPTGAFFGDNIQTIFWLNLSIMYSVNKKTNIFKN